MRERLARSDPARDEPALRHPGAGTGAHGPGGERRRSSWTHWDDLRNIYGVLPNGDARIPWDNVGVQYGLQALRDGKITPASSST